MKLLRKKIKENRTLIGQYNIAFFAGIFAGIVVVFAEKVAPLTSKYDAFLFLFFIIVTYFIGLSAILHIQGSVRKIKKENGKKKEKSKQEIVIILIGLLTLVIGLHQLVQPIFFPRVSSLTLSPLFIQSQVDTPETGITPTYYRIFKVTYIIEPTVFSKSDIEIKLPPNVEFFTPLTKFTEKNPYAELSEPNEANKMAFLDSNKFKSIKFHISTNGLEVKNFPLTLFFREKIDLGCSNLVFSNDKWWSSQNIPPDAVPKIECFTKRLGLGQINESGIVFSFDELIIRNRGELDVRGFVSKIEFSNSPQLIVCENKRELITMEKKTDNYKEGAISIDLKSGETRRFIILKQVPEFYKEDIKNIIFPNEWQIFDLTSVYCGADWNNFIH